MKKYLISALALLSLLAFSCQRQTAVPRPTVALVESVVADTAGLGRMVSRAGAAGPMGSIAIIGEGAEAVALAHRFQICDKVDNIDARALRDSLPDFAGETFEVILDNQNSPYEHFVTEDATYRSLHLDSLREAAVQNALFAWDSTRVRRPAKILIYTSSLQAQYGLFDVDTLLQLTGGHNVLLSPVHLMLDQAYESGARKLAVWTSEKVKTAGAWQGVFAQKGWADATLTVLSPHTALDVRTEFRDFLRAYRDSGLTLDALLLDTYQQDRLYLESELELIRQEGTEEDASFNRMIAKDFHFLEPAPVLVDATYRLLRSERLFTHRISLPVIRFYETHEGSHGQLELQEVGFKYVEEAYVQNLY